MSKVMRVYPWLVLTLSCGLATAGPSWPTQFVLNSWDTTTGLPEETIYSVAQTPDGYLWLANANGLVRYDGSSFHTYQPRQNLGGGVKQEITRMGPGPDNSVWVFTNAYGLVRFHDGVFRHAPTYPTPCTVTQIQEDGRGTLVVCNERVLRIEGEHVEQLVKSPDQTPDLIQSAVRDEQRRLWIGLKEGGLARLEPDGKLTVVYGARDGVPAGPVTNVVAEGSDKLWIGTANGLALVENGHARIFTTKDGLPSNHIRRLTLGRDGTLWVGTIHGVAIRREDRFETLSSLPSGWVLSIVEDREDNVWITFSEMNLYRLRKPKFLSWQIPDGLSSGRPEAAVAIGDMVWIADDGRLWSLTGEKLGEVSVPYRDIHFLEKDDAGHLWGLTPDKIFVYDPGLGRSTDVVFPAPTGDMKSLSRDHLGRMWIVTGRGLFVAENGVVKYVPIADLPPLIGRPIVQQSRDGRLWMSMNKPGLFELRDGRAVPVFLGSDPELKRICTFYIDSTNDFWFGFDGGGLARWRNGKLARYGDKIGKAHNFVYHFGEDTHGFLWLGLRSGLIRLDKAEINAFLDGTTNKEPKESYYDIADGLRSFNFGGANRTVASTGPEPVLWFPTLLGVIRIDSASVPVNRMIPPVHLHEVAADGRSLPLGPAVSIPAGSDILRFEFSVPTLVAQSRVKIRYQLAPFDSTWHNTTERSVSYSKVPPGRYVFSVSASNNDGVWNEEGAAVRVVVLPQFYQTWWFRLLAGVLGASAIVAVYLWRTARLRREKATLERRVQQRTAELSNAMHSAENAAQAKADFLATMSHEIRTPMHGVLGTLELLSETGLSAQQTDYLDTARNSGHSLLALLNNILDLSKMEAGRMDLHIAPCSLRQTVVEVTRLLQAQANLQGIKLAVLYAPDLPEYFEADEMRIRQIVFNLAGNAVKFTTRGEVAIETRGERKPDGQWSLRIAVRDTGIGIQPDRIPQLFHDFVQLDSAANRQIAGSGLGLAICHRLATTMAGSITVESLPGQGSTFSFVVDLTPSTPAASDQEASKRIASQAGAADGLFDACILLVEDNPVNQRVAIAMLKRLGCRVTLAHNGREAVEFASQFRFALILMDCQMPEMDGFEASRLIRERLGNEPIIVALTANSLAGDRERCFEAGMNDYLAKPFQHADLARVLTQYLTVAEYTGEPATTTTP